MGIKYLIGDATNPIIKPTIICHVVNTVNAFSAGFVVPLGKQYPLAKALYHQYYKDNFVVADMNGVCYDESMKAKKLQTIPFMLGETQIIQVEPNVYVANMVAQKMGNKFGKPPIRYEALWECLMNVTETAKALGIKTICGPRFGSGLSGGDWAQIDKIINETVCANGLEMIIYDLPIKK